MNNAGEMPIRVLKSRGPCSANYPSWLMTIIPMLSPITPQHLTPVPISDIYPAPFAKTGIVLFGARWELGA